MRAETWPSSAALNSLQATSALGVAHRICLNLQGYLEKRKQRSAKVSRCPPSSKSPPVSA